MSDPANPHPGSPWERIAISVGMTATVPPAGAEPRDLVVEADRCLYVAKRLGRDRVYRDAGLPSGFPTGDVPAVAGGTLSG